MENKAENGSIVVRTAYKSIIQVINREGGSLSEADAEELDKQYLRWVIED